MRYFAKYLPVEGPAEEGWCFYNGVLLNAWRCDAHDYTWCTIKGKFKEKEEQYGYADCRKLKTAKLFLCSRDIQVGDKYYNPAYDAWDTCDSERMLEQIGEQEALYNHGRVKVLGPISPHATWIKEGDDILSKNVHRGSYRSGWNKEWLVVDHSDDVTNDEEWKEVEHGEWKKCYLIEGPCGHYH